MHAPQPEQIERMRRMMLAIGPERAVAQLRAIAQRRDHRALLAGSTLPMCIVCGEEDRVTPMAMSEDIARCAPQAPLTRLPGIGHMVPLQQPQAVADALRGLLGA
jgi:pimeloyl-ACP methyl ester carboxylesterase